MAPELHDYCCCEQEQKVPTGCNKVKNDEDELSGCSEDIKEMVLLLLSYLDEKEDVMFCYVEDACLVGEVQMDHSSFSFS